MRCEQLISDGEVAGETSMEGAGASQHSRDRIGIRVLHIVLQRSKHTEKTESVALLKITSGWKRRAIGELTLVVDYLCCC